MKKTLIIAAHPNLSGSVVNKRWLTALAERPDRCTVHNLYAAYPDGKIDVAAEQARMDAHESVVLQFPVYWFNCPPLLKQWLDDVLTYGWAYGSTGKALENKKVSIAVSLGAPAADYTQTGAVGCTVAEALRPFELSMRYCNANWQPLFSFHTIDSNAGYTPEAEAAIEQSTADYLAWLDKFQAA